MNKKEMKFYEAPACEVVELNVSGVLCASNTGDPNYPVEDPVIE